MSEADSTARNSAPQLPKRIVNHTGKIYGRWTALSFSGRVGIKIHWLCRCECGVERSVWIANLVSGKSRSCGCLNAESKATANAVRFRTHGMSKTSIYRIWRGMIKRCTDSGIRGYPNYGGRGISVCERWNNSFENFYADMGERPSGKHSIDRINNDGNYEPENCRWATTQEQTRNTRRTRMVTFAGRTQCLQAWADESGISKQTISLRLRTGWTVEDALTKPVWGCCSEILTS